MQLPAWTVKLVAASVLPALIGVSVAMSAPSASIAGKTFVSDHEFSIGADGVDFAALTGPRAPARADAVPACADPARRGNLRPC